MKNLTLFQIILLCVFGALAISGVLIFALAVNGNQGDVVGPVTIWGTLDSKAFIEALQKASDVDQRFSQVTYVQKDPATYETDVTNALAGGGGPDLFLIRQDYVARDAAKVIPFPLSTLSKTQFENTFIDAANPFMTPVGALGLPLFVDPLVLYWNRDSLSSAGFVKPPAYWEEVPDMAQALTKRTDAGDIQKAAIAFGEYANIANAKDVLGLLILQAGGNITARDNTGRLAPALAAPAGAATQPTESALRFYTQFADPSNTVDYTWNRSLPEAQKTFTAGDLALYIGYASEAQQIARMNPNLNFAVAPVPQIRGADRFVDLARVYAVGMSRTGKNQNGAKIVASLLAGPSTGKDLATSLGIPSALRDILAQPAGGNADLFNRQAILARTWIDPDPQRTADIFRAMIERVTSGALRLPDAVARADQEMAQIINQ